MNFILGYLVLKIDRQYEIVNAPQKVIISSTRTFLARPPDHDL